MFQRFCNSKQASLKFVGFAALPPFDHWHVAWWHVLSSLQICLLFWLNPSGICCDCCLFTSRWSFTWCRCWLVVSAVPPPAQASARWRSLDMLWLVPVEQMRMFHACRVFSVLHLIGGLHCTSQHSRFPNSIPSSNLAPLTSRQICHHCQSMMHGHSMHHLAFSQIKHSGHAHDFITMIHKQPCKQLVASPKTLRCSLVTSAHADFVVYYVATRWLGYYSSAS